MHKFDRKLDSAKGHFTRAHVLTEEAIAAIEANAAKGPKPQAHGNRCTRSLDERKARRAKRRQRSR